MTFIPPGEHRAGAYVVRVSHPRSAIRLGYLTGGLGARELRRLAIRQHWRVLSESDCALLDRLLRDALDVARGNIQVADEARHAVVWNWRAFSEGCARA